MAHTGYASGEPPQVGDRVARAATSRSDWLVPPGGIGTVEEVQPREPDRYGQTERVTVRWCHDAEAGTGRAVTTLTSEALILVDRPAPERR